MMISKGTYIGLCLFLGAVGIHKFYSGKWFTGLLYAAFCWTGLTAVLALVDLLVAMFKTPDAHGQIRV